MPTVLRLAGFRFYFYSHEPNEPPHIHVDKAGDSAKFWLDPLQLAWNLGFPPKELTALRELIHQHQGTFLEAWHGYFGTAG